MERNESDYFGSKKVISESVRDEVVKTVLMLVEKHALTSSILEEINEEVKNHMLCNATLMKSDICYETKCQTT